MTLRTGMSYIVTELRTLCEAGTADYALGTVNFWSDDQLQNVLDKHAVVLDFEPMTVFPQRTAGKYLYQSYYIGYQYLEQTSGGTAVFQIMDYNGTNIGTALYSVDYDIGIVAFEADQGSGIPYFVSGTSYDLEASAAEVWHKKMVHYASAYNFSTDSHNVQREQLYTHAKEMAEYFEGRSGEGAGNISLERPDDTC
jgi:hypothetical protein